MKLRRIPGLVPGIFFLAWLGLAARGWGGAAGVSLRLSAELFAEGDFRAALVEAHRALAEGSAEQLAPARVQLARCELRLEGDSEAALGRLRQVMADEGANGRARCVAAYELGRAEWRRGRIPEAFEALRFAFNRSEDADVFWRAGCSLYFLMKQRKGLRREFPGVALAVESSREAWPLEVWRECRPVKRRGASAASAPGRGIVALYRSQISPAIGARCDLVPSCSEYFLQASRLRGLWGIPMMADRFVREPSVVVLKEKPVVMPDGRIRYADPVSDHDVWGRRKR